MCTKVIKPLFYLFFSLPFAIKSEHTCCAQGFFRPWATLCCTFKGIRRKESEDFQTNRWGDSRWSDTDQHSVQGSITMQMPPMPVQELTAFHNSISIKLITEREFLYTQLFYVYLFYKISLKNIGISKAVTDSSIKDQPVFVLS